MNLYLSQLNIVMKYVGFIYADIGTLHVTTCI